MVIMIHKMACANLIILRVFPIGMRVLVDAQRKLGIPWEDPQNSLHGDNILLNYQPGFVDQWIFTKFVPSIRACWSDAAIHTAFNRRSLFQISDSVEYFFENLDRIAHKVN